MKFMLRAKGWQLLLLFLVLPIVSDMIFVVEDNLKIDAGRMLYPDMLSWAFVILGWATWLYTITYTLNGLIREDIRPKHKLFGLAFWFSICMCVVTFAHVVLVVEGYLDRWSFEDMLFLYALLWGLVYIGSIYMMLFFARNLKTAEQRKAQRFRDYAGVFFLFFLFPLTVLFVQPRVISLISTTDAHPEHKT